MFTYNATLDISDSMHSMFSTMDIICIYSVILCYGVCLLYVLKRK